MKALLRRELRAYFDTPAAYVLTVGALLIAGYLFAAPLFLSGQASLSGFMDSALLIFLFFVPSLTMRLCAEENRSGTWEILAALPVSDVQVLAAKYLAALAVLAFFLAATLVFPLTLWFLGRPDAGALVCGYLGLFLCGAALAAVGLWASTLTRSQAVAYIFAFFVGFVLYLLGKLRPLLPPSLGAFADALGLDVHLDALARGVLDTGDLVYFASLSAFFLHLAWLRQALRRPA